MSKKKIELWFYVKLPLLPDKTTCSSSLSISIVIPDNSQELPPINSFRRGRSYKSHYFLDHRQCSRTNGTGRNDAACPVCACTWQRRIRKICIQCSVPCWLCTGRSCDFISILKKPKILLDLLDGVVNTHKMNDFTLRLGCLSLQRVPCDPYSRSCKQHIVARVK